jgi:GT2 family glycosyltransferase
MYGEDTDLSRRLWINGTPPHYYGKVSIIHDFAKGSHTSIKLLWIAIRSTLYYFNKWGWFDLERKEINNDCLKQFSVKK